MTFHFTFWRSLIDMTVVCFLELGNRDLTRALNTHMICHLCRLVFAVNLHISPSLIMDGLFRVD